MIRPIALQRLNAAYRGRARDESYLELAQEHFLYWMRQQGLLDEVVFKGGTSLRKYVFVSTDASLSTWTSRRRTARSATW